MRLLKEAVLWTAGIVFALLLAEISVRVAARYSLDVKYLATAGDKTPRAYASLEEMVAAFSPPLSPHLAWRNYYANAFGFTDREFSLGKPAGTRRIMALGDSFIYGMVGYPHNVLTLVEAAVNENCGSAKTDIMNFGIPATGVWEYRWVHKLAAPRYRPDLVIVHFYMGNDGPDLFHGATDVPSIGSGAKSVSYAWNYGVNAVKLLRSTNFGSGGARAAVTSDADDRIKGGERVVGSEGVPDHDIEPNYTDEAIAAFTGAELSRFYGGRTRLGHDAWDDMIGVLETIRSEVTGSTGRPPIMVLYPSELQVYPDFFETVRRRSGRFFPTANMEDFEATVPNRRLLDYCRQVGLSCHDLTAAMMAAARESPEPLYFHKDPHWNTAGNRAAAAAEAAALRRDLCPTR